MVAPDAREGAQPVKRVGRRRVTTAPAPGSDPEPQSAAVVRPNLEAARAAEDSDAAWGDSPPTSGTGPNDARLREDIPPHY